jgi:hypothetical protein
MFNKFLLIVALILGLTFINAFAADTPNSGTASVSIKDGYVVYSFTVAFSATDSVDNLTTKAFSLAFADRFNQPICVVAYGNAVAANDVNIALFTSNFTVLTTFVTSTCLLDAVGSATGVQDLVGGVQDSAGVAEWAGATGLYGIIQCDGQTGNTSGCEVYIKVFVPARPGLTQGQLQNMVGFVSTS